jgi:hypothetical protein
MLNKDDQIESLLNEVRENISKQGLKPDWRGNYFSSKMLNDLREIAELGGFEKATIYLRGKKDKRTLNRHERIRIDILLGFIEKIRSITEFDMETRCYIIGKLNQLLNYKKGGMENEKT